MRRAGQSLVIVCLLVAGGLAACTNSEAGSRRPSYPGAVVIHLKDIRFDDGDTFILKKTPIRFLGIDTPEIRDPAVGIFEDQPFGPAAAESTRAMILRAHVIELAYDGRDKYNRRLAYVFVDGELLGVKLLAYGLAYETVRHYGDNGFPDLADRIIRAADAGPKPAFEPPYLWRKEHQSHTHQ